MITMLILSCLASGSDCRLHVQAEGMSLGACMSQSQAIAASWANEHPKRRVAGIICADERRVAYYLGRDQA